MVHVVFYLLEERHSESVIILLNIHITWRVSMFWEKIESQYKVAAAHQFLLHFNVGDLQFDEHFGYLPALDFLMEQMNVLGCRLVIGYNATQGFMPPTRQNIERE